MLSKGRYTTKGAARRAAQAFSNTSRNTCELVEIGGSYDFGMQMSGIPGIIVLEVISCNCTMSETMDLVRQNQLAWRK